MNARLTTAIRIANAATAIFRKTQSFPIQAFDSHEDWKEHEHIGVEPMLLALSMELALKAWFVFDHNDPNVKQTHNLIKLFKLLKPESQETLDVEFRKSVAPSHPNFLVANYGIHSVLHQHQNAFTDWRYLHEAKNSMRFEQSTFEATLEMVLIEFRKRYRVVQVTSPRPS